MHKAWAAAEAGLLPGLRLCIWFFISNRLMCPDTAPLWEVADRHCQYFLLKKKPQPMQKCCFSASNYGACSLHLERRFPVQPLHFLHPWSPFFYCCLFLLLFRKRKERNRNIPCHFWQLLDWVILMAVPGCCAVSWKCSNIQESGTQNLEVGMKVGKIKPRHLEECFLPLCLCCCAVLLLHFDNLTVLLSIFSINSKARNSP